MKYLFTLFFLFASGATYAHDDTMLGEGAFHLTYHAVFWTLFVCVIYKIARFYNSARRKTKN